MKSGDRLLQRWRIAKTRPYIPRGARVLDIGCADGALFRQLKSRIGEGVGIDPDLGQSTDMGFYRLVAGMFPEALQDARPFDVITLLAVVEHVPREQQARLAKDCARFLKPGGHLLITVPSPRVDQILALLKALRLVDGMSLEQHYGFQPRETESVFAVDGVRFIRVKRFQLGLNNLFVFQKKEEN